MITSETFHKKSVQLALTAIEIYNKPNFSHRNEVFTTLLVTAWESLLKGKILLDNNEKVEALYVKNNQGTFKLNRTGNPLTMEIIGCCRKVDLIEVVTNNIQSLIEVRDNFIHFVNDENVNYLIFSLGVASLKNYHKICKEWFGNSIDKYNFYILPLGFVYNFKSMNILDLDREKEPVKKLIGNIAKNQSEVNNTGYEFICEIEVNLKSAKRITKSTDLEISINPEATSAATIIREKRIVDSYPLTATELYKSVKKELPQIRRNQFFKYIAQKGIKNDRKYSAYLFRNKRQKDNYEKNQILPNGIASLYNHDCLKFVIHDLQRKK